MVRMVSRQPLTAKFRFRSQGSPRGVCGGQSVIDTEAQYMGFRCQHFTSAAYALSSTDAMYS